MSVYIFVLVVRRERLKGVILGRSRQSQTFEKTQKSFLNT